MSIRIITGLAALCLLNTTAVMAADNSEPTATDSKRCLPITRIQNTKVIDDQHILFKMRGGPDYMNELPNKCPGLSKNTPFMYKTSLHELCDLDIITVLNSAGGGYMRGASCGLGKFTEYDDAAGKDSQAADQAATPDRK